MTRRLLVATFVALASCRPVNQLDRPKTAPIPAGGFGMTEALRVADQYRVTAIANRRIPHADYWSTLQPALVSPRLKVEVVGRSMLGREIRAITFGSGPTKVLLWSQMHGDEATASMALADILMWMTASSPDGIRDRLASSLTVWHDDAPDELTLRAALMATLMCIARLPQMGSPGSVLMTTE